jgi:hypothetical protein
VWHLSHMQVPWYCAAGSGGSIRMIVVGHGIRGDASLVVGGVCLDMIVLVAVGLWRLSRLSFFLGKIK